MTLLLERGWICTLDDDGTELPDGWVLVRDGYVEAAIRWLIKEHPYVDPARIGMSGHSYGGFLTAYALTHSTSWSAGW